MLVPSNLHYISSNREYNDSYHISATRDIIDLVRFIHTLSVYERLRETLMGKGWFKGIVCISLCFNRVPARVPVGILRIT